MPPPPRPQRVLPTQPPHVAPHAVHRSRVRAHGHHHHQLRVPGFGVQPREWWVPHTTPPPAPRRGRGSLSRDTAWPTPGALNYFAAGFVASVLPFVVPFARACVAVALPARTPLTPALPWPSPSPPLSSSYMPSPGVSRGRTVHEKHPVTALANYLYVQGADSLADILDFVEVRARACARDCAVCVVSVPTCHTVPVVAAAPTRATLLRRTHLPRMPTRSPCPAVLRCLRPPVSLPH